MTILGWLAVAALFTVAVFWFWLDVRRELRALRDEHAATEEEW